MKSPQDPRLQLLYGGVGANEHPMSAIPSTAPSTSSSVSSSVSSSGQSAPKTRDLLTANYSSSGVKSQADSGTAMSFEEAIAEYSDTTADANADFRSKLARLLKVGCSYLNLEAGTLIRSENAQSELIAGETAAANVSIDAWFGRQQRMYAASLLWRQTLASTDVWTASSFETADDIKCYIGCTVRIDGEIFGVLSFMGDAERFHAFSNAEKTYVRVLARYIGNELVRIRTKDALTYRLAFETLIASISTEFINLVGDQVDQGIRDALGRIANFSGVDLAYVCAFKDGGAKFDITHWWFLQDLQPPLKIADLSAEAYRWSLSTVAKGEVVVFDTMIRLPQDAVAEQKFVQLHGIQSAALVPMIHSGKTIGVVVFASRAVPKSFDEVTVTLLKMGSHLLATAMEYKRSQQAVKTLESQIQHAQKLESLGILAGGIAHDFNNLLMGIVGNAGLALHEMPFTSPARVCIRRIEKISQHAAQLTNQLLAYSGKGKFFVEPLNLSETLSEMLPLLEAAISKKHTLKCNFPENLPLMEGDGAQISQVMMNLVTNASEAIGDSTGMITLNTGLIAVNYEYLIDAYLSCDIPEGVYVYIRVSDSGCGMTNEIISKIFDPFYTTKFTGRGLGLAAVLGIVRAHGGTIKVRSVENEGATFTVLFPCAANQELPASIPSEETIEETRPYTGNGLILVVDDEEPVRVVVAEVLKQWGFDVLTAPNGKSGLEIFREHSTAIDIAIVDMTMPDMSGQEVFRELLKIKVDARVILTSGYSEQEVAKQFSEQKFGGFIQKPYRPQALIRKVFELLQLQAAS